jgi:hypothetical protein
MSMDKLYPYMTEISLEDIVSAIQIQNAFELVEDVEGLFTSKTTVFDAKLEINIIEKGIEFRVEMEVPTIDSIVLEEVEPIIKEGWLETFSLRLEDIGGAVQNKFDSVEIELKNEKKVVIIIEFSSESINRGIGDAKAIVDYIEGTYREGIIPGFKYDKMVADLIGYF